MGNIFVIAPAFAALNALSVTDITGANIRLFDVFQLTVALYFIRTNCIAMRKETLVLTALVAIGSIYSLLVYSIGTYSNGLLDVIRLWLTLSWSFLAYSTFRGRRDVELLFSVMLYVCTILSIYTIYIYATQLGVHRVGGLYGFAGGEGLGRQSSFNETGAFLVLGFISGAALVVRDQGGITKFACLLIILIGILLTGSRSSLLGLVAAVTFGGLLFGSLGIASGLKRALISVCVIIILLVSVRLAINYELHVISRIVNSFDASTNSGGAAVTRLHIWSDFVDYFNQNVYSVLIGLGKGATIETLGVNTLENFWLDTVFSYGFLGFSVVCAIFFYPTLKLSRKKVMVEAYDWIFLQSSLIAMLVVSMTGNVLADPMLSGTYLILVYALSAKYSQEDRTARLLSQEPSLPQHV